jgi:hypothetical protein
MKTMFGRPAVASPGAGADFLTVETIAAIAAPARRIQPIVPMARVVLRRIVNGSHLLQQDQLHQFLYVAGNHSGAGDISIFKWN